MKTYCETRPPKARTSRLTSSASNAMKLATTSKRREASASRTPGSVASPLTCSTAAGSSAARWPRVRIVSERPRSTLSRAETVRRLRFIRPATSFRSGYAYDNVLYVVAGQLIEEVSGRSWERFVREEVLVPAGMRTATSDRLERRRTPNRAWPHARRDGPMHGMGTQKALDDSGQAELDPELGQNAAPAGGVAASATDMGRWIAIKLARGALPDGPGRVWSEAAAKQMWTPRVLLPISPSPGPTAAATPQWNAYALGWTERDYKGRKLLMHTGAVFGAQAIII